jgi:hypothetical protein
MQGLRSKPFVGVLVASSLFLNSTGAVAAPAVNAVAHANPWAALTAMSGGAPAAALCGAAAVAAAAQAPAPGCVLPVADAVPVATAPPAPIPVPPVEPVGGGFAMNPLFLALGALAAGALLYFVLNKSGDDDDSVTEE